MTEDPDEYNLTLGQLWETVVVNNLNANGLEAYRPKQNFVPAPKLKAWKALFKEWLADGSYSEVFCWVRYVGDIPNPRKPDPKNSKVLAGSPEIDKALLRPYQRDVMVKIGKYKRLSVEVKALTSTAWIYQDIMIGCCPKWDEKKFKVGNVIIINQDTDEAFVAPPRESWVIRESKQREPCYAINQHLLIPLDVWIADIKQAYKLGDKV